MKQTLHFVLLACAAIACAKSETTQPVPHDTVHAQPAQKREEPTPMQLTQQDGEALRAALVAWLKQSQLGDRDELLKLTEHATVRESSDALIGIGLWTVVAEGGELIAKLRQREGISFDATFAKENGTWKVRDLIPVHIHPRR